MLALINVLIPLSISVGLLAALVFLGFLIVAIVKRVQATSSEVKHTYTKKIIIWSVLLVAAVVLVLFVIPVIWFLVAYSTVESGTRNAAPPSLSTTTEQSEDLTL